MLTHQGFPFAHLMRKQGVGFFYSNRAEGMNARTQARKMLCSAILCLMT
jgi:hypothetical protein